MRPPSLGNSLASSRPLRSQSAMPSRRSPRRGNGSHLAQRRTSSQVLGSQDPGAGTGNLGPKYTYIYIYTHIHPSVRPSVRPSIHPSIHPYILHAFLLECMHTHIGERLQAEINNKGMKRYVFVRVCKIYIYIYICLYIYIYICTNEGIGSSAGVRIADFPSAHSGTTR